MNIRLNAALAGAALIAWVCPIAAVLAADPTDQGPLPAAEVDSPEDQALAKFERAAPKTNPELPSRVGLFSDCESQPRCKAKLEARHAAASRAGKASQTPQKPRTRSVLSTSSTTSLYYSPTTEFSVQLTPKASYVSDPLAYLRFYGGTTYASYYNTYTLLRGTSYGGSANTEQQPFAVFMVTVPTSGNYMVSVQGSGGAAKMRHNYGGPILEAWEADGSYGTRNYSTVEHLAAGRHYFYFWPTQGSYVYFFSASVAKQDETVYTTTYTTTSTSLQQ